MKSIYLLLPLAAALLAAPGCTTMVDSDDDVPLATRAEVEYLRGEIRRLNDRQSASESEFGRFQAEMMSAQDGQSAFASAAQV